MALTPPYDGLRYNDDAAATPPPLRTGWFRFYFDDERWEWSDEVALIHGYEPRAVTPTTALVMSHKHPDDRAMMSAHLEYVRRERKPVSTRHRIINVLGETREVVVAGQEIVEGGGEVVGTTGFYIDVTPTLNAVRESATQQAVTEAVATVVESRTQIDQLKGMLMLIYGIDADAAFSLLKWRSQSTNVKLRLLARQLVEDFLALAHHQRLPERTAFDNALLTAHLRVKGDAA
ncbi:PAS and ANTAR domain-containing protein [Mycolicibacterium sp.]|uniref:PAS and ANTAR domain-containing protein n=1 Tax=Mycolicibacterium sp. TaxID=2320850 RepID=UPI001A1D903F|nr:PAS and ANTAR domain-containing protein [Mycolicibacterium sp.]MBJ7337786.1 ANTAR domain-containing protein [Mycolicibacterium sp.]